MLWNQAGWARKILFFVFLLSFFLIMDMAPEAKAAVCVKSESKDSLNCVDTYTADECAAFSGQYLSTFENCLQYNKSLDPVASGSSKDDDIKKSSGGLSALKESVDTLTKAGKATKSLEEVIGGYIKTALTLVGTLFVALTFYGGYIWFIAREDEEEAKRARSIISMALIGLIVVLAAYSVTYFIIYRLTVASGTGL